MAEILFKGKPVHTRASLPALGSPAPEFRLTRGDLSDAALSDFKGKALILNIVPSLETSVCALSAKRFELEVKERPRLVVLTISRDIPFAQVRFCKTEGVENVVMLSELRDRAFGRDYGVEMVDGPLAGLLSRAVVAVDPRGVVVYTEQVPEIGQEPDYRRALEAVQGLL
jgi:thiol peroxidase